MRIESPLLRNIAILALIAASFTVGTFAAEFVGNMIQPPPTPDAFDSAPSSAAAADNASHSEASRTLPASKAAP